VGNPLGLKLRFYQTGVGEVSADYTVSKEYQGYPGVVHGGIVAAMLDEAAGRAHMGSDPPRFLFTARLNIRYRKNVPVGVKLHLVGTAGISKSRTAVATSAIYGPDGDLLAEAEALLVDVPAGIVSSVDLEDLGWRVYPEEELVK